MHPRRSRTPPPWERENRYPIHSTGPARRRWPRAYDGGLPAEVVQRRYRRAYDGELRAERRRGGSRSTFDSFRHSPIRNGLIGLAVAGTAAPIAINKYQQALRTDPSHESIMATGASAKGTNDNGVTAAWRSMESSASSAANAREAGILASIEEYSDFDLGRELAEEIYDMAAANEIDPEVAFGLVRAESSFKNSSTSPVGAVGLTQLMPKTAEWLEPGVTKSQLRDARTNLRIGFKYLRQLIDKYEGDTNLALVAYNRGPGTVDRVLSRGGNPDNGYAAFVKGQEGHGHSLFTKK